jgi:hypothetical protein
MMTMLYNVPDNLFSKFNHNIFRRNFVANQKFYVLYCNINKVVAIFLSPSSHWKSQIYISAI